MTQKSWLPWETQTGTGDGQFSFDQDNSNDFFRHFDVKDPTTECVRHGVLNALEVTGAASPIQVDTGAAVCYGRYWNDAAINLVVATPIATTGGRVILETDWATNTIRAVVIMNTIGVTAPPAITQTAGTLWQMSLASFEIDNAGVISALSDERHYIGQSIKQIFFQCQATTEAGVTISNWAGNGFIVPSGVDSRQYGVGLVPDDFVGGDAIVYCVGAFNDTNDYYYQSTGLYIQPGLGFTNGFDTNKTIVVRPAGATGIQRFLGITVPDHPLDPDLAPGDYLMFTLIRWGADVLDTGGGGAISGWVLEYTGIDL